MNHSTSENRQKTQGNHAGCDSAKGECSNARKEALARVSRGNSAPKF